MCDGTTKTRSETTRVRPAPRWVVSGFTVSIKVSKVRLDMEAAQIRKRTQSPRSPDDSVAADDRVYSRRTQSNCSAQKTERPTAMRSPTPATDGIKTPRCKRELLPTTPNADSPLPLLYPTFAPITSPWHPVDQCSSWHLPAELTPNQCDLRLESANKTQTHIGKEEWSANMSVVFVSYSVLGEDTTRSHQDAAPALLHRLTAHAV